MKRQNDNGADGNKIVPRQLTQLESHFRVMAGIQSLDPNAEFSFGPMYTACRERGSTRFRAALTTFLFCTLGKLKGGFMLCT